jgi:hypothetical protein
MKRLRELFDLFEQRTSLMQLLDLSQACRRRANLHWRRIGTGPLDECSVVTAPYEVDGEVVGSVGVIGPTRMAYERVIPIVDITAKLLSSALTYQARLLMPPISRSRPTATVTRRQRRPADQSGDTGSADGAAVRRYLKEFLSDPRVVEIPRPLWWLILNGIILNIRPRRSAEKYAAVWTAEGSPLKRACRTSGQVAARLSWSGRASGARRLRHALR